MGSSMKASSFLGFMSIRTGLFVISLLQIATGILCYVIMHYFRPSLRIVQLSLIASFTLSAILGVWGAWKRSRVVEIIYFVSFAISICMVFSLSLEFCNLLHTMPPAPGVTPHPGFMAMQKVPFKEHLDSTVNIPFIPKNENEGDVEEVAASELPPETKNMPANEKNMVVAVGKMNKEGGKIAVGLFLLCLSLFYLYCGWIILTFILNKCTSLDELTGQPEQFEPLVSGQ